MLIPCQSNSMSPSVLPAIGYGSLANDLLDSSEHTVKSAARAHKGTLERDVRRDVGAPPWAILGVCLRGIVQALDIQQYR
jgi:hypothetical protein